MYQALGATIPIPQPTGSRNTYVGVNLNDPCISNLPPIMPGGCNTCGGNCIGTCNKCEDDCQSIITHETINTEDCEPCLNPCDDICPPIITEVPITKKDFCILTKANISTTNIDAPKVIDICSKVKDLKVGYVNTKVTFSNVTFNSSNGGVNMSFRRKSKMFNIQWEEFTVVTNANVSYISLLLDVKNLPPHPIKLPYIVSLNNKIVNTYIDVTPSSSEKIKFYLNKGKTLTNSTQVQIHGGSVSWGI